MSARYKSKLVAHMLSCVQPFTLEYLVDATGGDAGYIRRYLDAWRTAGILTARRAMVPPGRTRHTLCYKLSPLLRSGRQLITAAMRQALWKALRVGSATLPELAFATGLSARCAATYCNHLVEARYAARHSDQLRLIIWSGSNAPLAFANGQLLDVNNGQVFSHAQPAKPARCR
jgi:hypothetical protein